jgi:hypothetical protein
MLRICAFRRPPAGLVENVRTCPTGFPLCTSSSSIPVKRPGIEPELTIALKIVVQKLTPAPQKYNYFPKQQNILNINTLKTAIIFFQC